MPYAACSASNHPAPSPSSTRPADIWSTPATLIASGPGIRNVAAVTSVPSRMVDVSRASAGEGDPRIGRPGQPADAAHLEVVVAAEERAVPELLGAARDGEQVVVRGALLGLGEHAEVVEQHVVRLGAARRGTSFGGR